MDDHLDEAKDKDNIKGIIIGRCFCLAAIIKSGRVNESKEIFIRVLNDLFKIARGKDYLRQLISELLIQVELKDYLRWFLGRVYYKILKIFSPQRFSNPKKFVNSLTI